MTPRPALKTRESALHFRLLAEHSTDVISRATPDGTLLYVSPACLSVMGYRPEELQGTSIAGYLHPDDAEKMARGLEEIDSWTEPDAVTFRLRHKDGRYVWIEASSKLVREPGSGRIVEIQTSSRDVTSRLQAEQALRDSEARFRLLADNSSDVTARQNEDGTFLYVSPSCSTAWGYDPEELLGTPSMRLVHRDDRARTATLFAEALRDRTSVSIINRLGRRGGEVRWFDTTCTMGRDPVTGELEIHSTSRDITDRKRADDAMRESEEWFRNVFEGSPIGMSITDEQHRYVRVNDACCDLLGYSREELLGMRFVDVTYAPHTEQDTAAARALASGDLDTYHCEKRYVRKNGEVFWANLHVAVLPSQPGAPRLNLAMVENISERKRVEEELRSIAAMKSDFVTFVSHELRAPLTTISVGLSLLGDNAAALGGSAPHTLELLTAETQRLTSLVESILDINRFDAAELPLTPRPVALDTLIRRVVAHSRLPDGRLIKVDLPDALPLARCDETQTEEVVRNLIGNAAKYGGDADVVIAARVTDGATLAFSVRDAGPGIPENERAQVFDRHYRGHGTAAAAGGYGLGLYFARMLIEAQGGRIDMDSRTIETGGRTGTTFTVTLPRAAPAT
jgi:PAS domain S-box-containing protein